MKVIDKNWPWQLLAAAIFIAAQLFLWWMVRGFNQDFGMGFAMGGAIGAIIVLGAVGWRRGEHRS